MFGEKVTTDYTDFTDEIQERKKPQITQMDAD
jgi:hypothetical protein